MSDGEVFQPYVSLYSRQLRHFWKVGAQGRETSIGEPILDLDRLRHNRLLLTKYETVVNYQHSFARMKQWSVIVTDDAQEYKTPSTRVSHAPRLPG